MAASSSSSSAARGGEKTSTSPANFQVESILIVSPYAHMPGHHWPNAAALGEACLAIGLKAHIITALPPMEAPEPVLRDRTFHAGGIGRVLIRAAQKFTSDRANGGGRNLLVAIAMFAALRHQLRQRFSIAYVVDATYVVLCLWILITRVPTIYYVTSALHGVSDEPHTARFPERILMSVRRRLLGACFRQRLLHLVCETEAVARACEPVAGKAVTVIPYAIDVATSGTPSRAEARVRLGLPASALVLLVFGTHRRGKDYRLLFEAASRCEFPLHLLFVGKVISDNDPAGVARSFCQVPATFVSRFVSKAEVPAFFAAADAIVLPYEGDYTKGSGVLLEACRFGRSVIVPDIGHLGHFVRRHAGGLLYRQADAGSLADALRALSAMPEVERALLDQQATKTGNQHSWPIMIERYVALFERMASASDRQGFPADRESVGQNI